MTNTATVYSIGTRGSSVKVVGTRAAVMTSPAEVFGTYSVTLWVNVKLTEEGKMGDGTIVASGKSFKTEAGALKYSNRHLEVN